MKLPRIIACAALAAGLTVPVATFGATAASATNSSCGGYNSYPTLMHSCFTVVGYEQQVSYMDGTVYNTSVYEEQIVTDVVVVYAGGSIITYSTEHNLPAHTSASWLDVVQACYPNGNIYAYSYDYLDPQIISDPGFGISAGAC